MLRRGVLAGYRAASLHAAQGAHVRPVGAVVIPGARRGFADAKQEGEKKDEGKKDAPPKAGPGFWATFKKSYNDAFSKKAAEDVKLAEAQQTLDKGKEDAAVAAGKAFEVRLPQSLLVPASPSVTPRSNEGGTWCFPLHIAASRIRLTPPLYLAPDPPASQAAKRAAEEAKKRADVIDEKTRPARDAIGQQVRLVDCHDAPHHPTNCKSRRHGMKCRPSLRFSLLFAIHTRCPPHSAPVHAQRHSAAVGSTMMSTELPWD